MAILKILILSNFNFLFLGLLHLEKAWEVKLIDTLPHINTKILCSEFTLLLVVIIEQFLLGYILEKKSYFTTTSIVIITSVYTILRVNLNTRGCTLCFFFLQQT